jgi:uncharacterized protein YkwD
MKKNLFYYFMIIFISVLVVGCTQISSTPTAIIPVGPTNLPTLTPAAAQTAILTPVPTIQPAQSTQTTTTQSKPISPTPPAIPSPVAPSPTPSTEQSSSTTAGASTSCTDTAGFFGDLTIPDGTSFKQNTPFVKTWRVRNEGTCTWGPDYSLIFYGGDQMSGPLSVSMPVIAPGEIGNISVNLKSPSAGGAFTGLWEFQNPSGKRFGVNSSGIDQIWVKIGVTIFNDEGVVVPVGSTPVATTIIANTGSSNPESVSLNNSGSQPSTSTSNTTTSTPSTSTSNPTTSNPSANTSNTTTSNPSNMCTPQENSDYEQQILGLINNARAQNNLTPLSLNGRLSAAAVMHSTDMACKNYVDHTGSDGSTWFTRIQAKKYKYSYASENIYVGNPAFGGTPGGAFTWWMNSQIHRDNILSIKVSDIGIGYEFYPNSTYGGYYTLDFAKP